MSLLNVPYLRQIEPAWCLPACVAMVAAFHAQPITQEDAARWMGTRRIGTPASNIRRLEQHGFVTVFGTGSLRDIGAWVERGEPCVLFVRTGELGYWELDTPHAVVFAGIAGGNMAQIYDPAVGDGVMSVPVDELLLAWSHFDYAYAVIQVE